MTRTGPGALTREQVDGVADRLAAGEEKSVIGAALGLSRGSIAGIIYRLRQARDPRVPPARRSAVMSKAEQRDAIADAFADGAVTLQQAAAEVGLSVYVADLRWREVREILGWQAR